jgi:DNA polymerase III epsilon subunit-like protein
MLRMFGLACRLNVHFGQAHCLFELWLGVAARNQRLMKLDFVAVDVECANPDLASICQIGVATVQAGEIVDTWSQYVDPEDHFHPMNIRIHGVDEITASGSPTFDEVFAELDERLSGIVVSHSLFDRASITRAAEKCGLRLDGREWLDSARIARRAWPDKYARRGCGLANVATDLGIAFDHHDGKTHEQRRRSCCVRAPQAAWISTAGCIALHSGRRRCP